MYGNEASPVSTEVSERMPHEVYRRLTADIPELSRRVADIVHQDLPSYRIFDSEDARRAVERNMEAALHALSALNPHPADDFEAIDRTIVERFEANVESDEVVRAFAMCIWQIHQRYLEICQDLLLSGPIILDGSSVLWQLGNEITTHVVTTYSRLNLQRSLADMQARAALVRRLLTGLATPKELTASAFGPDGRYAAVRCMSRDSIGLEVKEMLEDTGSTPDTHAMLALVDGECMGVVADVPQAPQGVLVAMGPFVPSPEIPRSFVVADKVAHVAHHLRRRGVQSAETLTWRLGSADEPEIAAILRSKYLDPLRHEGEFGTDIEHSLRTLLANGMDLARTAKALNVHINTLRHRLRRFSEITGANLDRTTTLIELTWVFQLGAMPRWTPRFG